jgi:hypothetical protein
MSKKLWHTIQIKVPAEMVELTKTGKISVKKTLTKTLNISKSQKKPAIKLIPSNDNKVEIVNDGKEWNIEDLKSRMTKAKQLEKKNANKNIFEPKEKRMINLNKFEGNIIKRARELGKAKEKKMDDDAHTAYYKRRDKPAKEYDFRKAKDKLEYNLIREIQDKIHNIDSDVHYLLHRANNNHFTMRPEEAQQLKDLQDEKFKLMGAKNIETYFKKDKYSDRQILVHYNNSYNVREPISYKYN